MEGDGFNGASAHHSLNWHGGLVFLWRSWKLGIRTTGPSDACADMAISLAAQGREDADAVRTLVRLAGGNRRRLTMAAQRVNLGGRAYERDVHNRGYRLLEAALSRTAVRPVSPQVKARIDTLEYLSVLPPADAFALLCEREPRLRPIEDQVRRQVKRAHMAGSSLADAQSPQRREMQCQIWRTLKPLLGPDCSATDPVLTAATASQIARQHLYSLLA